MAKWLILDWLIYSEILLRFFSIDKRLLGFETWSIVPYNHCVLFYGCILVVLKMYLAAHIDGSIFKVQSWDLFSNDRFLLLSKLESYDCVFVDGAIACLLGIEILQPIVAHPDCVLIYLTLLFAWDFTRTFNS